MMISEQIVDKEAREGEFWKERISLDERKDRKEKKERQKMSRWEKSKMLSNKKVLFRVFLGLERKNERERTREMREKDEMRARRSWVKAETHCLKLRNEEGICSKRRTLRE